MINISKTTKTIIILLLLVAGLWLGLGTADRLRTAFRPAPPEPMPPRAVETLQLAPRAFERWHRYPGVIAAEHQAVVSSQLSALIRTMPFRAGDRIEQGDLLVTLADEELRRELNRLNFLAEATAAELELARHQLERREQLFAEGAINREALEESQARAKALNASLAASQQAAQAAASRLAYTRIQAPFSGVIGQLHALPGDLVNPGQPLLELVAVATLKAEFVIPQRELAAISTGTPVLITVPATTHQWAGFLDRLHPDLKPPGRGARAETLLPPEATEATETADLLRPGMTASIRVLANRRQNSLVIPIEALDQRRGEAYVFIVEDGQARRRPVLPGPEADGWVVIEKGLAAGDQLITTGYPDLADGDPVLVKETPALSGPAGNPPLPLDPTGGPL